MAALSYKEFIEEVRTRISRFTADDFRSLILYWASEEPSSTRQEFLNKLIPRERGKQETLPDATRLIEGIEAFAQRVEDGDYCDGWGWDDDIHEERDWGDESWAREMDGFFLQTRSLLLQGDYESGEGAYLKLFSVLEMGEEPGHLPGADYANMLEVDLNEQVALFLRCVYMNSAPEQRPASIYDAMNKYRYLGSGIKLKSITGALDVSLPDFDVFLADWIEFLKNQDHWQVSEWLREAVIMKGGVPAIAEFAREYAATYPLAYMDWIRALEAEGDTDVIIRVAREGLSRIPRDYTVRAEVADVIAKLGESRDDLQLKLEGHKESFYSSPSMERLVDLYTTAIECGCFEEIREEAEQRMAELRSRSGTLSNNGYNRERHMAYVRDGVFFNALLLAGKYEEVFEHCRKAGPLGWSNSDNPKPVMVAYLMIVLSKGGEGAKVLLKQWEDAIGQTSGHGDAEYIGKYRSVIEHTITTIALTGEQEQFFLRWCMDEVGKRVDAIVGNQHRGSYHKAAGLLVAMAETLAKRGERQEGVNLIEKYRSRYPRHSAFRNEVSAAMQRSKIFESGASAKGTR
jgi:tetratricopeptide (TPR) repeat protein